MAAFVAILDLKESRPLHLVFFLLGANLNLQFFFFGFPHKKVFNYHQTSCSRITKSLENRFSGICFDFLFLQVLGSFTWCSFC